MTPSLTKYIKLIDDLSNTTKTMILAALVATTFILWHNIFWQNLQQSISTSSEKIRVIKNALPTLKNQLENLEKEIKEKQNTGEGSFNGFLSPEQTKTVLHDLLGSNNNLILLQFNNLPPEKVLLPQNNMQVFEHGMIIKFLGDYFSTMKYLQDVENLPWKIFWDKFEYKVIDYPKAEVTLYIHTINTYDEWIHV